MILEPKKEQPQELVKVPNPQAPVVVELPKVRQIPEQWAWRFAA